MKIEYELSVKYSNNAFLKGWIIRHIKFLRVNFFLGIPVLFRRYIKKLYIEEKTNIYYMESLLKL